jgi:hypothetical protein
MTLRVISLGAGVQSTTMALMAAHGELTPPPDAAIFADTGAEPKPVYEHLKWLRSWSVLPFPAHVVSAGNLAEDLKRGFSEVRSQKNYAPAPFFIKKMKANGAAYELSMGRRQCTQIYKIEALAKEQRRLLGYEPRARIPPRSVEVWIGISLDEAARARPARQAWQVNRYPLLEKRMTRRDCLKWLDEQGYPTPPKSACTFCPFRSDDQWLDLKKRDPEGFQQAVEVDGKIRDGGHMTEAQQALRSPLAQASQGGGLLGRPR